MMIEQGEVIKTQKDRVVISFDRKTECKHCGMCAFGKDDMKVKLTLKNDINAKIGDIVEVSMGDRFVLASASIVYLIPIALIGLFLGLAVYFNLEDYLQIILSLVGLVLGFVISFLIDKKLKNKRNFSPQMTKIVGHVDENVKDQIDKLINNNEIKQDALNNK